MNYKDMVKYLTDMEYDFLVSLMSESCKLSGTYDFIKEYEEFRIPEEIPNNLIKNFYSFKIISRASDFDYSGHEFNIPTYAYRDIVIYLCGYCLIDKAFASNLAKFINGKKCLEIMSGLGALSYALKEQGVDIIATDIKDPEEEFDRENREWLSIEQLDCIEAIKKYGSEVDYIICSWPRDNEYLEVKILDTMREINPNCRLIYIGDDIGGCCASLTFFDKAIPDDDLNLKLIDTGICIKHWNGVHDIIGVYK